MPKLNFRKIVNDYEEPNTYVNISEVEKIPVDMDAEEKEFNDRDGQPYTAIMAVVDDVEFRVPKSVIGQVASLMEDNAEMEYFKVRKTGTGLQTAYFVSEA